MATEKKINSRIQQKHDVAANWAKATNFIPKKGELIIYDAEYNTSGVETTPVRFKIGNGSATVNALPFVKTDNGVKLGGGTVPSGLTGSVADSCIDQVYANILDDGSQRNYFPQLMSRIESGQLLLVGIDLSTEMAIHIMHITGVIENEVTASQGTPVEGSNAGVYHFIIAEKSAESGSEKFLLWAEKTGSAFSKYRSAGTGSTETFSASVTAGWNSNYVNTTTGLCNLNSLVSGGNFTWVLMSTAMAGQDVGATPTGNYFFAGSPFTIEYEAQVGQMAVLDRQLSGGYRKGYYIGSANLESSNSTWQNYQAGTDIGSSIVFNTALKNSTIGACLSNICSLSPSGNCIVRTYGDSSVTYKIVPILSDSVDGNGEWTLYAGAMLEGSAGTYYGLFLGSQPLTKNDPLSNTNDNIYYWNQWVNLSSTGAWTTDAGSRKAKYVNFEALSLLYQYAMFGEYNIVKLPLRKVAEAQGSYAKVLAEAVQDKQDKLSDGQITAANSGVTAAKVTKYDGYENIINGKQDAITASNKLSVSLISGLAKVATSGSYHDLEGKPSIPTKTSEITNDSGFITSDGSVKSVIDYNDTSKKIKIGYAGTGISGDGIKYIAGYTAGDSESEAKIKDISKDALKSWLGYAAVATSGSYNDLSDKPSFDKLTRIQKQAYTGGDNTVKYFKLASFPVYNSGGNYASFIITGRMGGWQADNMSFVNMILYNRNGEGGGYINVANSAFFNLCDIVMYREEDGTSTAYLKVKSYYTFDINVNTYQATNVYTGTDDTPTGTLKWTASEQADRLAVSGGVAYVNGFTLPKQVEINGETVNPNSAGLINLGTGFAKAVDLPIKSATLTGTTLYLTL
nr:MAG TPA: hyaluronidase [Caudoviricetes sp.]